MQVENIKQIITYLRSTRYISQKTYSDDFSNVPRPFYNFLIMIEGEAHFYINDQKKIVAKGGDLIWLPKGSTFYVEWIGSPASWHVLHFDFSFLFNPFFNKLTQVQALNPPQVKELLADFDILSNEKNPYLMVSVFYRIFAQLFPLIHIREVSENQYIIQPAFNYLEAHYKEKIYVKDLAAVCLLSPSRFQHLFKELTGMTPIAYKNQLLIQHVQQALLINVDKSLDEIANEYGFESTIYFCRLFKKNTGLTPTEYRQFDAL